MEEKPNKEEDLKTLYLVLKEVEEMWTDIKNEIQSYYKSADKILKAIDIIEKAQKLIIILTLINLIIAASVIFIIKWLIKG